MCYVVSTKYIVLTNFINHKSIAIVLIYKKSSKVLMIFRNHEIPHIFVISKKYEAIIVFHAYRKTNGFDNFSKS